MEKKPKETINEPYETPKKPCKKRMKVYIVKYLWGVAHVLRVPLVLMLYIW